MVEVGGVGESQGTLKDELTKKAEKKGRREREKTRSKEISR